MHLPAFPHGVASFLWAAFFGAFVYFGGVSVGISSAMAAVSAAVCAFVVFLYVRLYGEDAPRRP